MENGDLDLTSEQIRFLLSHSMPPLCPYRDDYFSVLDRVVSSAKNLGDADLLKNIYVTMPFYPADKDIRRRIEVVQSGISYFLSLGLNHEAGLLCFHLAWAYIGTEERLAFCERALTYLDKSSKIYACALARQKMLCHMFGHINEKGIYYFVFGEKIFWVGNSVFISPIRYAWYNFSEEFENIPVLKGYNKFLDPYGYQDNAKTIINEALSVGESNHGNKDDGLVLRPDEIIICQADREEYVCQVFSYRRHGNLVTNYFVSGIRLVRAILLDGGKKYIYELCEYSIKGGDGLFPLCVGNKWCYRHSESIGQIIEREIVCQILFAAIALF